MSTELAVESTAPQKRANLPASGKIHSSIKRLVSWTFHRIASESIPKWKIFVRLLWTLIIFLLHMCPGRKEG
jgi:hypothetical protein